ncbi:MAG: NAD kinase [Brachybacterium sp.]|nr:NAD kinase [Brachybacterium sp.]
MRRFLLYAHTGRASALEATLSVLREMIDRGVRAVMVDHHVEDIRAHRDHAPAALLDLLDSDAVDVVDAVTAADTVELALVLGGDGTILRALDVVRAAGVPLHGINLGHVGFLAESEVADLSTTVHRLLDGDYQLEERATLDVVLFGEDRQVIAEGWAMNEAAVEKADRQRMLYTVIEIDGRPVSAFGCDGVLLSTSTGSTAYAFSAGGPVVWPEVDAFLVVPLAAHALFSRPLVLGRSSRVAIEITPENQERAVLTLDGRRTLEVPPGSRAEATLSTAPVRLVRLARTPFADRLVEKFQLPVSGWRGRDHGAT